MKRLDGWKKVFFSLGDRTSLLLSFFQIPMVVAERIERLMCDVWGVNGRWDHLVSWSLSENQCFLTSQPPWFHMH